jgi:hypothetical protein
MEVLSKHLSGGTEENCEKPIRCLGQDSNWASSKYNLKVLPLSELTLYFYYKFQSTQFIYKLGIRIVFFLLVGSEVFTAVVMKSIMFWDMTPCSALSFFYFATCLGRLFFLLFSPYIGQCLHFGGKSYVLFIVLNASYRHNNFKI